MILIVGAGLAGCCLGLHLLDAGRPFMIVDDRQRHSASRVAAGLMSPLGGKRLTLFSPDVKNIFSYTFEWYRMQEKRFSKRFFYPKPTAHFFSSNDTASYVDMRRNDSEYTSFLGSDLSSEAFSLLEPYYGGVAIHSSAYLDVTAFLDEALDLFRDQQCLVNSRVEFKDLHIHSSSIRWKSLTANAIVFCSGFKSFRMPLWDFLTPKLAKGDVLTLQLSRMPRTHIIKRGYWLLPFHDKTFKFGSTYIPEDTRLEIDSIHTDMLLSSFYDMFGYEPRVVSQQTGVRPVLHDRQPIFSPHPMHRNVYLFNGLGSKGVTLAPFMAHQRYLDLYR